jgi:D-glycerate 3-kinase
LKDSEVARVLERAAPAIETWLGEQQIESGVREQLASVYAPLAAWVAQRVRAQGSPFVLGMAGAQGTGKSTLAALVALLLDVGFDQRAVVLSLDDLYLTRAARVELARSVHPLLVTRGVPGTHDLELGARVLDALCAARAGELVRCPRFDKAQDDRAPESAWPSWSGPTDVVLLEGWCVGAAAEGSAELATPINALEREHDADGRFRSYVDAQLRGPYQRFFARLNALVFLAAPDLDSVRRWRREQEHKLAARTGAAAHGLMSDTQLEHFVQHFERVSRHMLRDLPSRADVVLSLGADHQVAAVHVR